MPTTIARSLTLASAGLLSLREAAAQTHMVTAAAVRKASDREAQEARERWWASLDTRPCSIVMAPIGNAMTVPVDRGLTPRGYLREAEEALAEIGVQRPMAGDAAGVLAAHLAGQSLGAVPDLSPCTLPPRPPVTITFER